MQSKTQGDKLHMTLSAGGFYITCPLFNDGCSPCYLFGSLDAFKFDICSLINVFQKILQ